MAKKEKKKAKLVSSFFEACSTGQTSEIKKILAAHPSVISARDDRLFTALHFAVLGGQTSSLIVLLNWGADPNITKKLIERGAEPWRQTSKKETCLHAAVEVAKNGEETGVALAKLLLYKKKYQPQKFKEFTETKNGRGETALRLANKYKLSLLITLLSEVTPPKKEHEITILLHGWNDNLEDWRKIEENFNKAVQTPFHLFEYDSLADRITIGTLAEELRIFIEQKVEGASHNIRGPKFIRKTFGPSDLARLESTEKPTIFINILCYSTGGLIVRTFLKNHYYKTFRTQINRVIFLAPANMGSPFAKFGKSGVGKLYTGQKKVGSLFECGEELLTSLEPNSPFIWDLATDDIFQSEENQYFVPSEIMGTIIQGIKHYPKNMKSKVTRGDMRGTDGTVTISGASLRAIRYSFDLTGGSSDQEVHIQKSTSDVALRLHPGHTHRSLIDSLLHRTDIFFFVRRALETSKEQFKELQQHCDAENEIQYSACHTPGNLLLFQYHGTENPVIIPLVVLHHKSVTPGFGTKINLKVMKIENRASVIGAIQSQFNNSEYHSRDRKKFYKIADLPLISKALLHIKQKQSDASMGGTRKTGPEFSPSTEVSLAFSLRGHTGHARIFASTSWKDYGDCFYNSNVGYTSMFTIAPLTASAMAKQREIAFATDLSSTDNSTFALNYLTKDECLDMTVCDLGTMGIIRLLTLFHRDSMLNQFIELTCKKRMEEMSGKARAILIRALVPFFSFTEELKEACAYLIYKTSGDEISALKKEMDRDHSDEPIYTSLPSNIPCNNLHQLVFSLLNQVQYRFLRFGNNTELLSRYIIREKVSNVGISFIKLGVMVSESIFKYSEELEIGAAMKYLVFVENTIQPHNDPLYVCGATTYPGVSQFLSKVTEGDSMDIVLLKADTYQREVLLEGVSFIALSYPSPYDSDSICQFIIEYLSLYPEYYYSVIGNSTPHVYGAIKKLFSKYEGEWAILRDFEEKSCATFANVKSLDYNFSIISTWVDAAVSGYEQDLYEPEDLLSLTQACQEDLQQGITKGFIKNPSVRWKEIIQSIQVVLERIESLPHCDSQQICLKSLGDIHSIVRNRYAGSLLSNCGVDMILHFHEYFQSNPNPNMKHNLEVGLLTELATSSQLYEKLAMLFEEQKIDDLPSIERSSDVTSKQNSWLMVKKRKEKIQVGTSRSTF